MKSNSQENFLNDWLQWCQQLLWYNYSDLVLLFLLRLPTFMVILCLCVLFYSPFLVLLDAFWKLAAVLSLAYFHWCLLLICWLTFLIQPYWTILWPHTPTQHLYSYVKMAANRYSIIQLYIFKSHAAVWAGTLAAQAEFHTSWNSSWVAR